MGRDGKIGSMQDTELYRHLLNLTAPWTVARVELNSQQQRVDVWAEHPERTQWPCPECGQELGLYDHSEERAWRHLDSCQFETYLHARPPRVRCPQHGVRQVRLPWAEGRARFTAMFERLAIDVLREMDVAGAMRVLRISWDEAWHLLKRAVRRGLLAKKQRPCAVIGVDETAAARGQKYITVVCDLEHSTVEYIGEDRRWESLDAYYTGLTDQQLPAIEAVAMDMWDPYIKATRERVPEWENKIVFDRFHVMQQLGKAVDKVRKQEHRALLARGDGSLTGSKYLWLYSDENRPTRHDERFYALKAMNLKTGRAWSLKESLRELWRYHSRTWAERYWKRWYFWATHSRLQPIRFAAKTLKVHLNNIFTYFRHRITNATTESLNAKIQRLKRQAHGYRNVENFKTAIFFHCGGLDLYPRTHAIP
jgi:transposase